MDNQTDSKALSLYWAFQARTIDPLMVAGKALDAIALAEDYLSKQNTPSVRKELMAVLVNMNLVAKRPGECLRWLHRGLAEFPEDALIHGQIASWYHCIAHDRPPSEEDLACALNESEAAVRKARKAGKWLRITLANHCRICKSAGRYDLIAPAMEELLNTLPIDSETPDIPYLEYDWLKQLPDGLVDPELVARYMRAAKESRQRLKKSSSELFGEGD